MATPKLLKPLRKTRIATRGSSRSLHRRPGERTVGTGKSKVPGRRNAEAPGVSTDARGPQPRCPRPPAPAVFASEPVARGHTHRRLHSCPRPSPRTRTARPGTCVGRTRPRWRWPPCSPGAGSPSVRTGRSSWSLRRRGRAGAEPQRGLLPHDAHRTGRRTRRGGRSVRKSEARGAERSRSRLCAPHTCAQLSGLARVWCSSDRHS